LDLKDL
jgi:hypothetical protein